MASLSRQLAQWIAGLRYENLPPKVVDRAKGVTLHCLASVLLGSQTAAGKQQGEKQRDDCYTTHDELSTEERARL